MTTLTSYQEILIKNKAMMEHKLEIQELNGAIFQTNN